MIILIRRRIRGSGRIKPWELGVIFGIPLIIMATLFVVMEIWGPK